MKLAAIDIGTNAVRLLLSRVLDDVQPAYIKKESLVRMPIRLGEDVFTDGRISAEKQEHLIETVKAFRLLMSAYESEDYLACATAAMREAENGPETVKMIRDETGIDLEIIDGRREAEIICLNRTNQVVTDDTPHIFVDVGGGSTEVVLFAKGQIVNSQSFPIGGVRILKDRVEESEWKQMKKWLKENARDLKGLIGIGSGGNINKAARLAGKKEGESLTLSKLTKIHNSLKEYAVEDRIRILHMRPDRADVIVPALEIYRSVMKWAKCTEIVVPLRGLADGLVRHLYDLRTDGKLANGPIEAS